MPSQDLTNRRIAGRYDLDSTLGRGGMGVVWRARDSLLQRHVAVKEVELPSQVGDTGSIRPRVLREARAAARLNHPHAVTVYDVIEEDGKAFIVMELVGGTTLSELVTRDGPLEARQVAEIATSLLGALEAAHREGIVHRDVKPGNVMIDDGRIKLADFGIASVKDDPKITASGLILGSPSFMAPEQAERGKSGPESDLWGLGATMYFAVEGAAPFSKEGAIPTLAAVVGEEPRPMRRAGRLEPIIRGLLDKDPERRPAGDSLRRLLAEATSAAPAGASQATTETRPTPLPRRRRLATAATSG